MGGTLNSIISRHSCPRVVDDDKVNCRNVPKDNKYMSIYFKILVEFTVLWAKCGILIEYNQSNADEKGQAGKIYVGFSNGAKETAFVGDDF